MAISGLNNGGQQIQLPPQDDRKVAADLEQLKQDVTTGSGNLAGDVRKLLTDEGLLPHHGHHHGHHHKHHHVHHHGGQHAHTVSADDLHAGGQGQAGGLQDARLQSVLAQIRDVSSAGIDLLARVMIAQQGLQRHEAVQDRVSMRNMARSSLLQAAGELQKQASEMETAAIENLAITCATSAMSIAATGVGSGLKMGSGMDKTSKLFESGGMIGGFGESLGKAGESGAKFADSQGQIAVKNSESTQKIDEADAQQYDAQADLKKSSQDAMDDGMKQIIQFLKDLRDAKAELMSAITKHA